MPSTLDRLYTELITASGVHRIRDTRLELLAMDRALEARFEVGTGENGTPGITHPVNQLIARTFPHRLNPTHAVHENAVWNFSAAWQDDFVPEVVSAWMESEAHRNNLLRITDTHWGLGYHIEPPDTSKGQFNNRVYVIAVFTTPLVEISPKLITIASGTRVGRQLTASGRVIDKKTVDIPATGKVPFDHAMFIPSQKRVHYHLTDGPLKEYWVKAGVTE